MGKEVSAKPTWLVVLEMSQGTSFTRDLWRGGNLIVYGKKGDSH